MQASQSSQIKNCDDKHAQELSKIEYERTSVLENIEQQYKGTLNTVIFMECSEEASKELKKDCHRRQYIRDRNLETSFQVMSYSTMTFHDADICGEDVLEDEDCNVEEEVVQRLDIERVRAALKALTPEERDIIMNFYFSENPLSGEALAEKFATTKSSIYRRRDHALRKLKSILGNA